MNLSEDQKIIRDLILSTDVIQDYIEHEITFEECIDEFQSLKYDWINTITVNQTSLIQEIIKDCRSSMNC